MVSSGCHGVISGFLWLLDAVHGHQWFSRSVGPTQMFMLELVWLIAAFGHKSKEENYCQL